MFSKIIITPNNITNSSSRTPVIDRDEYLHELNTRFARIILPAIVVLAGLMVIGIIGNVIVLYVYCRRMKTGTITRYIQGLALFDLLSCSLAIPGEIIDMTNNYTFGSNPLCQIVRTANLFCTMASGSILIVVAIDRYKRICYPLGKQISTKGAMYIMVACSSLAFLFSLPTAVIFGSATVPTNVPSIHGSDCSVNDRIVTTVIPIIYNGSQMFVFLVGAVILIVLYSIIARRIFQHAQGRQRRRSGGNLSRTRRRIWSMSYCSSPSMTPELEQDYHMSLQQCSPDICHESKVHNVYFCEQNNDTTSCLNKKYEKIETKKLCLSDLSHQNLDNKQYNRHSNSDNDLHMIERNNASHFNFSTKPNDSCYEHASLELNTTDSLVHGDNIASWNHIHVTGSTPFDFMDKEDCLKTRSLPNTLKMEDDQMKYFKSKEIDLSPPPTPIEELDNQKRWLLTSSGEIPSKYSHTNVPSFELQATNSVQETQEDACSANLYLTCTGSQFNLKQLKLNTDSNGKKVFKTEMTSPSRRSGEMPNSTNRRNTNLEGKSNSKPEYGSSLASRRRSTRLSFKGLADFRKLSLSSDSAGTRRTTLMLFVITLIYILSFLPHLLLMIFKTQSINWLSQFGETGEVLHNLLIRSYFINSASNPIIYSFFSKNFFTECQTMIKKSWKKRRNFKVKSSVQQL